MNNNQALSWLMWIIGCAKEENDTETTAEASRLLESAIKELENIYKDYQWVDYSGVSESGETFAKRILLPRIKGK